MAHTLETERLLLRPWATEDVRLLSALSSIPLVTRYIGDGQTWTELKAVSVSERALKHWREHGFGWRVIIESRTGKPVGLLALNRMGDGTAGLDPQEHEIGWWLAPDRWGHGYAAEAARAVAADAFSALAAPHVTARIAPDNEGSLRVAAAIGMEFEFNTVAQPGIAVAIQRLFSPHLAGEPGTSLPPAE